ncbi:hypothetical protein MTR67_017884, partial [Solanum verrucosum]
FGLKKLVDPNESFFRSLFAPHPETNTQHNAHSLRAQEGNVVQFERPQHSGWSSRNTSLLDLAGGHLYDHGLTMRSPMASGDSTYRSGWGSALFLSVWDYTGVPNFKAIPAKMTDPVVGQDPTLFPNPLPSSTLSAFPCFEQEKKISLPVANSFSSKLSEWVDPPIPFVLATYPKVSSSRAPQRRQRKQHVCCGGVAFFFHNKTWTIIPTFGSLRVYVHPWSGTVSF